MHLMSKLYELTDNYRKVWEMVDDDTVDLAVIEDTLQSIEGELEEKAGNIAKFVKSMEYDVDAMKAEEKRISERRKATENRINNIKAYVQMQMELANLNKIKTPTMTISLQKNPPSVSIEDDTAIPAKYIIVIPEQHQPDKKRIAEALKNGEVVPGAVLKQGKNLRIR